MSDRRFWRLLAQTTCIAILALAIVVKFTPLKSSWSITSGYHWANVSIGGGGYVTGIYLHPRERNLAYIRTDMGGFYRWNSKDYKWIPLTDIFSLQHSNYYGGEALALDPNNPDIVYIAAGKYTTSWGGLGTIFKSSDRGQT